MIKGHTDIDIWNTGFFINADYFSDDFIIYNNTGKDLTRKTLAHPFFHNNSYKTTYTSFILCLSGTSDERVFLCGASSKDAGARITSIVEDYGVSKYAPVIATLLKNPTLILPQ